MKSWEDLTPEEQKSFTKGRININGMIGDCFYKQHNDLWVELYCDHNGWIQNLSRTCNHYQSLV